MRIEHTVPPMTEHSKIFWWLVFLLVMVTGEVVQAQTAFLDRYPDIREESLTKRRFSHHQIQELIQKLPPDVFQVDSLGASIEGKAIYSIRIGKGPQKVLLWSQMHGDEPTATMAIFDILNYLMYETAQGRVPSFLQELSLCFIPMLNPDGADRFRRRNALNVDLNRDALRSQSPEAFILKTMRDTLQPDWGFNLHDQNRYTSAGKTHHTASISFLAPAYNEAKDWDQKREDAMRLIASMNAALQPIIPDQVGRYSDEFEPRAFGDNIQKWGTRTILIETGGRRGDLEKQYLRKMNYLALLTAFEAIKEKRYAAFTLKDYEQIPYNSRRLHELIIRKARLELDKMYTLDLAFRNQEVEWKDTFWTRAGISDIGDLHNYYGYTELDASGLLIQIGAASEHTYVGDALSEIDPRKLLAEGITYLRIDRIPTLDDRLTMPQMYLLGPGEDPPVHLDLGHNPSLVLRTNLGDIHSVIVNGRLIQF